MLKIEAAGGDIDLGRDGQCHGTRRTGQTATPLDGPYTVRGDKLTFGAEPGVTYVWLIVKDESGGTPRRLLTLTHGLTTYRLARKGE